jgi:RNA polymerase sigma factor (sigma-70 family)
VTEEQQLIAEAGQGNEAAMEALFRLHVSRSVRLAYLICGDWGMAEDAVQEAFVRAFRSMRNFRKGAPFAPWFTRIVVNQAKNKRSRTRIYLSLDHTVDVPSPTCTEEEVLARERERALLQAVNRLDEKHRLPVLLKYFSGHSEAETAQILGLPVSTVKSRLHTARGRLKSALSDSQGGQYCDHAR